jgi:hypothetical protein
MYDGNVIFVTLLAILNTRHSPKTTAIPLAAEHYFLSRTNIRTSMLSRLGAPSSAIGLSNEVCGGVATLRQ